jgi:hypothetical protein
MPTITLQDYEKAERLIAREEAGVGLTVHGIVTLLVATLLVVLNITIAGGFPWSAFAVGGMLVGLAAHWWFGFTKLDDQMRRQQRRTEARAAALHVS